MSTPAAQKAHVLGEALPYLQSFHGKTFVIKYGGAAMTDAALRQSFARDVAMLQLVGLNPIVVHGGEPQLDSLLETMGVRRVFRRGILVTDEKTLNAVEMVLGELNQEIVGLINQHGGKAIGLNGQDGHFIRARQMVLPRQDGEKDPIDLGFVGEIESIDPELMDLLHSRGFIPVVMPIGVGSAGEAYSIDADVVAGRLAETLTAEQLILMTDAPGVVDRRGRLIAGLSASEIEGFFADGTIQEDSYPKVSSALHAVRNGVKSAHIIDGRLPHALLLELLTSAGVGTMILSDDGPHFLADSRHYFAAPG